jgi:hypothetical protein
MKPNTPSIKTLVTQSFKKGVHLYYFLSLMTAPLWYRSPQVLQKTKRSARRAVILTVAGYHWPSSAVEMTRAFKASAIDCCIVVPARGAPSTRTEQRTGDIESLSILSLQQEETPGSARLLCDPDAEMEAVGRTGHAAARPTSAKV